MPNKTEATIYRMCGFCAFLAGASLVVPRFVPNPEGGFASGATAVLVLLIMLAVTFFFSLYLLAITVQRYRTISVAARVAGIGPSTFLVATLLGLLTFLRY